LLHFAIPHFPLPKEWLPIGPHPPRSSSFSPRLHVELLVRAQNSLLGDLNANGSICKKRIQLEMARRPIHACLILVHSRLPFFSKADANPMGLSDFGYQFDHPELLGRASAQEDHNLLKRVRYISLKLALRYV